MEQEMISVIMGVIVWIIIISYLIIRKIQFKKVEKISLNVKKVKEINDSYIFKEFFKRKRTIRHRTKSYKSFGKTNRRDVIGYHIENNIKSLRDDIETAIKNKELYEKYLIELNGLDLQTNNQLIKEMNMSIEKFQKIEKKLIKKLQLKKAYNIKIYLIVYYQSPKGKNFYRKNARLNYNDIVEQYNIWDEKKNYEISARYERSIMSDSIRYDVLKRDDFKCNTCGVSSKDGAKLHVDHIVPVSKGGKTVSNNLQTLCERCNLGKSNKL